MARLLCLFLAVDFLLKYSHIFNAAQKRRDKSKRNNSSLVKCKLKNQNSKHYEKPRHSSRKITLINTTKHSLKGPVLDDKESYETTIDVNQKLL